MDCTRLEPIGSNCEFGFVLEQSGDSTLALFRWTFITVNNLCRLLEADFEACFALETTRPHTADMVMDTRYEWAFHSALKSDGEGNFMEPPARLSRLFKIEQSRVMLQLKAFRERLATGNLICVYSADGVTDDEARRLLLALDAVAGNATNTLLLVGGVQSENEVPGQVSAIDERIMRGFVTKLAPYDQANKPDMASWTAVLQAAA
jgi:hypothetical protein